MVRATLMTTWGKKGRRSVFRELLMRCFTYFPLAEGLSSFAKASLKKLRTTTAAEIKQVISAQLQYSLDRAHSGSCGNNGRGIERSRNGSGTSNPQ